MAYNTIPRVISDSEFWRLWRGGWRCDCDCQCEAYYDFLAGLEIDDPEDEVGKEMLRVLHNMAKCRLNRIREWAIDVLERFDELKRLVRVKRCGRIHQERTQ